MTRRPTDEEMWEALGEEPPVAERPNRPSETYAELWGALALSEDEVRALFPTAHKSAGEGG